MSLAKQYTTEITQGLQYLPTWLPIRRIGLGDFGPIRNNTFEPEGNIQDLNITFKHSQGRSTGSMRYYSRDGVSIFFKVSGAAPALGSALTVADAGVVVKFSRAEAVVFEAEGCKIEAIADLNDLGRRLIGRYQQGNWDKDLYVITEMVCADAATILVSSGTGASIELRAGGKVNAAGLSLADLGANFSTASTSSMGIDFVAQKNLTPLFKAYRVRPTFFSTKWENLYLDKDAALEEEEPTEIPVFSQMSTDDLWPQ